MNQTIVMLFNESNYCNAVQWIGLMENIFQFKVAYESNYCNAVQWIGPMVNIFHSKLANGSDCLQPDKSRRLLNTNKIVHRQTLVESICIFFIGKGGASSSQWIGPFAFENFVCKLF